MNQRDLDEVSKGLGVKIQQAIEEVGMSGYEIETLEFRAKADVATKGLSAGCRLKCSVSGIPPKVSCKVECSF